MKNKFLPIIAAVLIVIFGVVFYSSARINNPTSSSGSTETASSTFAWRTNNLSDLNSSSTARLNLGLTDTSTQASSTWLKVANNLSDGVAATMRNNLGLGSMSLLTNNGSSTIDTLGTITTGVWNGTVIDLGYISTSSLVAKATNYKPIPWSASYTSSTQEFDDIIFTFKNAATIDNIYVSSRDTANSVTYNFYYAANPSASTSTSNKVLATNQTVTSTPAVATNLTSFASSTPAAGDVLRLWSSNASSSLTSWTIWYHEN